MKHYPSDYVPFTRTVRTLALLAVLAFGGSISVAAMLGMAFTYQGRLTTGGIAANGLYDLKFTLYDDASGGAAVGGPVTNSPVGLTDGLFTATLDFGAAPFSGEARWLEIGVRTNGSGGDFTLLVPRQPLTPLPYALYAPNAGKAQTVVNGVYTTGSYANPAWLTSLSGTTVTGNISGNAAGFTGSLAGDVTGPQGANLVASVGGQPAANVASAVIAANAATSANTPNTIVKRDASGNFSATFLLTNKVGRLSTYSTNIFNVREYGAVGNGIADDTVAIANAWTAWLAIGGVLYFPGGSYIDTGVHDDSAAAHDDIDDHYESINRAPYVIAGDGMLVSKWVSTGLSANTIWLNLFKTCELRAMSFVNRSAATNLNGIVCHSQYPYIENIEANQWTGTGLTVNGSGITLNNIGLHNDYIGLRIPGFGDGNSAKYVNAYTCKFGVVLGGTNYTGASSAYWTRVYGVDLMVGVTLCDTGVVIGAGGNHRIALCGEQCSNSLVSIGSPPGLYPALDNDYESIQCVTFCDGYCLGAGTNATAFCKLYRAASNIKINNYYSAAPVFVRSMISAADASSITFENVNPYSNPIMQYSDGASLYLPSGTTMLQLNGNASYYSYTNQVFTLGSAGGDSGIKAINLKTTNSPSAGQTLKYDGAHMYWSY